jgi:hypothetical protein
MAWFKKRPDPISDRERALSGEIAELEVQIKRLDAQLQRDQSQPRLRSTAMPHGANVPHSMATLPAGPPSPPAAHDPIFEEVAQDWLKAEEETAPVRDHFNDLGVRKYDLPALLRRIRDQFRGPSASNPKLVSYLAAGGIQGLGRPLRYEKRVARYRFIAFVVALMAVLFGLLWEFARHRQ